MKGKLKGTIALVAILVFSSMAKGVIAYADEVDAVDRYYFSDVVNAGLDTGYSAQESITEDDLHFGWQLGKYYVTGFSAVTFDAKGNPVFLRSPDKDVELRFQLEQDPSALNGDSAITVNNDENGYDEFFGLQRQNFGRGAMIIRHTDSQNNAPVPQVFVNYLSSIESGSDEHVTLCEEGDYDVALDYEVEKSGFAWMADYANYRIAFSFSVRDGDSVVFPMDVVTGAYLGNESHAPNGFKLDFAGSKYLKVTVERSVLSDGPDGKVEDILFARPGEDGEAFTDEGVYTLKSTNEYTGLTTVKKVYVGNDETGIAYASSGLPLHEVEAMLANDDRDQKSDQSVEELDGQSGAEKSGRMCGLIIAALIMAAVIVAVALRNSRNHKRLLPKGDDGHAE